MAKIRVLLVDDHTLFRHGLNTLISAASDMEVAGEASNGGDAVEKAAEVRPDVVLMDISMPGLSSFEATRQIRKNHPETKVMFLTMYDDQDYVTQGMAVGATGAHTQQLTVPKPCSIPGHYRVALAVNSRTELPLDPEVITADTDRGPRSVSAKIQNSPQVPVLADGLWVHTAKVDTPWETDVELPNINCKKCTLQIVQFMAEHGVNNPGNFTYHHCADLQITATPAKPIDKQWPVER